MRRETHAYFEALKGLPARVADYSLRSQAQLENRSNGGYATSNSDPLYVTYNPDADTDPRRQDAAKVIIPNGKVNLPNQVRVPIPSGSNSLIVTWDAWFGREFEFDNTGIDNYKNFQLASTGDIWTEIRSRFIQGRSNDYVSKVDIRFYGNMDTSVGWNVTRNTPLEPQINEFGVYAETWTRYWVELRPNGEWYELTFWMADETRDPVMLHDHLLVKPKPDSGEGGWNSFWLEYNTSNKYQERATDLVSYVRNIVMLRGLSDPRVILQKPVK